MSKRNQQCVEGLLDGCRGIRPVIDKTEKLTVQKELHRMRGAEFLPLPGIQGKS